MSLLIGLVAWMPTASATTFTFQLDCDTGAQPTVVANFDGAVYTGPHPLVPILSTYQIPPVDVGGFPLTSLWVVPGFPDAGSTTYLINEGNGAGLFVSSAGQPTGSIAPPTTFTTGPYEGSLSEGWPGLGNCTLTGITEGDALDLVVEAMQPIANAYYPNTDPVQPSGVPARLQTSSFRSRLASVRGLLQTEGCTVSGNEYLAGAYQMGTPGSATGEDDSGALVDAVLRNRSISGTVGGAGLGDPIGRWDDQRRFVVSEGEGFYVGEAVKVAGRRGVFMGLQASCPDDASPEAALAGWFHGDLTGLDYVFDPATFELAGDWEVEWDCGQGAVIPETWTITASGPSAYTVSSSIPVQGAVGDAGLYEVSGSGFVPAGSAASGQIQALERDLFTLDYQEPPFMFCTATGTRSP